MLDLRRDIDLEAVCEKMQMFSAGDIKEAFYMVAGDFADTEMADLCAWLEKNVVAVNGVLDEIYLYGYNILTLIQEAQKVLMVDQMEIHKKTILESCALNYLDTVCCGNAPEEVRDTIIDDVDSCGQDYYDIEEIFQMVEDYLTDWRNERENEPVWTAED